MQNSQLPVKFPIRFAASAGNGFIRAIPQASQIGITPGAASLTDGFPPLTFQPVGSGGVPPFGQDFNGILSQVTAWNQWQQAGGTVQFDQTFSNAIGGYPNGAILQSTANAQLFWLNIADNNTTNPDGGSPSGWVSWGPAGAAQNGILLTEIATPAAPGAGLIRFYAKSGSGVLAYREGASGPEVLLTKVSPTVQRFTSGSSLTYTPTAGFTYIRVRMVGGGAGFSTGGGTTSFGTWTAIGGTAGTSGGAGGTGGANGTGTLISPRIPGQAGGPGFDQTVNAVHLTYGGQGGSTPLGAGGAAMAFQAVGAQSPTGFGSGAGGSNTSGTSAGNTGSGSGEYVEFFMTAAQVGASQTYTVGAAGTGTPNGAPGVIIIEELYS